MGISIIQQYVYMMCGDHISRQISCEIKSLAITTILKNDKYEGVRCCAGKICHRKANKNMTMYI